VSDADSSAPADLPSDRVDWLGVLGPAVIRDCRIKAGLTQSELADAVGVATPTVCHWEKDRALPRLAVARELRRVFGRDDVTPSPEAVFAIEARGDYTVEQVNDVLAAASEVIDANYGDTTTFAQSDVRDRADWNLDPPGMAALIESVADSGLPEQRGFSIEADHPAHRFSWAVSE